MIAAAQYPRFDVIEYIKSLRNVGVKQDVAETQAQGLESALNSAFSSVLEQTRQEAKQAFDNKELATKGDVAVIKADIEKVKADIEKVKIDIEKVKVEIEKLRLEMRKEIAESSTKIIMWVAGLLVASGMIQHFFK